MLWEIVGDRGWADHVVGVLRPIGFEFRHLVWFIISLESSGQSGLSEPVCLVQRLPLFVESLFEFVWEGSRRDMHNTAEPDSCTGAAPPPGARRFTVSYQSACPGGVRAWSVIITSPPSRRWCTSWGPPRDRAGWPRAARRASWRAARRQAAAPPRAPAWRGGRRGEHSHAAAPPPAAAPPRRRAHTSLHSSSVLERMRTTSPSDRSVC